ncbi:hypothetical protein FIBSPDRAFT_1050255 [Athelia psychrophila]|uniref:Uncharacterized protein n=1 Tax=Athelia psychrophila TaxID=1759441 RepID=A0A166AYB4_9AGAM|nr:hypothetical protein FIBSPDRAFT_1050255 [Fibularhizoctonia sp. CBS 109695]
MDASSSSSLPPRPRLPVRNNTDILSYYQSEVAGQPYTSPVESETPSIAEENPDMRPRQMSNASSPSEYSPDGNSDTEVAPKHNVLRKKSKKTAAAGVTRRPSIPSTGGADRRRMKIVDMGTGFNAQELPSSHTADSLRSRRGMESPMQGLALIAPPDASPKTYMHLTPPTTAPLEKPSSEADPIIHHRSVSEVGPETRTRTLHQRKSSRQVGIIGTTLNVTPASCSADTHHQQQTGALQPPTPILQIPQSRSPSPDKRSQTGKLDSGIRNRADFLSALNLQSPEAIVTPAIGEAKSIHDPVAAPVIVNLTPSSPPRQPMSSDYPTNVSSPSIHSASSMYSPTSSSPSTPFSAPPPKSSDPFLHYQPGVHATAGPLPPPPRAMFDIKPGTPPPPRPPRFASPPPGGRGRGDVAASTQALRAPEPGLRSHLSTGSLHESRSASPLSISSDQPSVLDSSKGIPKSASSEQLPAATSAHVREGAFAPSTFTTSTESESSLPIDPLETQEPVVTSPEEPHSVGDNSVRLVTTSNTSPPIVVEPVDVNDASEVLSPPGLNRDDSWVDEFPEIISRELTPNSDDAGLSPDSGHAFFKRSPSASPPNLPREIGDDTSPSSTPRHLGSVLAANLKRFSSLPRTPSRKSDGMRFSTSSHSSNASSMSTLPPPLEVPALLQSHPPMRKKIISPWPAAMSCGEVAAKKSALERSLCYANKINELYIHDCGLGDFLMDVQHRGTNLRVNRTTAGDGHRGPSTTPVTSQPRHVSRSSIASEATFPRRADTTSATDLAIRVSIDTSPPRGPPPLPYPSLAPAMTSRTNSSSSSSRTPLSPTSSKLPIGFFSSLGRKASMKSTGKGTLVPQQPSSVLHKSPAKAPPNPRPVHIDSAPTVPGGPRAVPNKDRPSRSQTIMLPKTPPSVSSSHRSSSMTRRASLFGGRRRSPGNGSDSADSIEEDPEFKEQVDKLADLLPQAERAVLARYLRRAGSDLNAIGQYLEDEKNGTLQMD